MRFLSRPLLIHCLLGLACVGFRSFSTPLEAASFPLRWRWSNPTPHGGNISDMAEQDGLIIQVAERGQVFASQDLELWLPQDTGLTNSLRGIAVFGNQLLISGESGIILRGNSPGDLQRIDLGTADWLESIAASPSMTVAVGDNGAIYTSPDGLQWQRRSQSFTTWLRGVAFGAGVFVAVGENGFIASTTNGVNWQPRSSGTTSHLNRVAWVTNRFWAVGDAGVVLISTLGSSWQRINSGATNTLFAVAGNSTNVVVAGDHEVRLGIVNGDNFVWSNELSSSNPHSLRPPEWTLLSALWDGRLFLLGGRTGMIVEGFRTNSTSSMVWVTRTEPIRNWLWDVFRTPIVNLAPNNQPPVWTNFYVAVGDHATIMTSGNGLDWELESVPDSVTNSVFLGTGGTANALVTVGNQGAILYSPNLITNIVTANATNQVNLYGILWETVEPRPTTVDLQGVGTFGDMIIVTGGSGKIFTSTDGRTWSAQSTPTTSLLSSITAFPGGLVAVGKNGVILTSSDGASWALQQSGTSNWISRVRFLNDRLIAIGQNGTILTSANGVNWTAQNSGTPRWLNDAHFLDNQFFINGTQGAFLTSTNAVNWVFRGTATQKSIYALASQNGQLLSVGVEGAILRSQIIPRSDPVNFLNFSRDSGRNLFLFFGLPDQRFTIGRSGDFKQWTTGPLLEILDGSGTLLYLETSNAVPAEFFRTTLAP